MLAKKHRLTLRDPKLRELFRFGRQWRGRFFSGYFDFGGKTSAVGLLVPKSVIHQATDRAAVRRRVYDMVGSRLHSAQKLRLLIRVTSPKILADPSQLEQDTNQLFEEISHVNRS